MRKTRYSIVVVSLLAMATTSSAETPPPGPANTIFANAKLGGLIPVSKLSPHLMVRLGGGYISPWFDGRLGFIFDIGYSQTKTEDTVSDARLGIVASESTSHFSYTMTQQDLNLFLGPQIYFLKPSHWLVPYATVGLDLHFLKSKVEGTGNANPLGENEETSTKAGFEIRGGLGYHLGPGMVTGELTFSWAPIDHQITGESHLGRLCILIGYAAMFGL